MVVLSLCDAPGLGSGFLLEPVARLGDFLHPVAPLQNGIGKRAEGKGSRCVCFHDLIWESNGHGDPVDDCDEGVTLNLGFPDPGVHRLVFVLR